MPTQEQINAANVELQIANDNYAALADRYNRYNKIFESYANATPEAQERARGLMQSAMEDYNQLRQNMYAAEDRINVAQNAVNNLNKQIAATQAAAQQQVIYNQWGQRRRVVIPNSWYNINNNQQPTLTNEDLARKYFWDNWYYVVNTYPDQTWYKSNTSDSYIDPNWWVAFWPAYEDFPRNTAWPTYNNYVNAWAEWGTKWMTDYLRTLPNPYTHTKYANSLYNDMLKEWVTRQQADDFIRNWTNAHTP